METGDVLLHKQRRRAALLLLAVIAVAATASSGSLHQWVQSTIDQAERAIAGHEVAGVFLFVLLSACSAMVVFFSTAVITPVAIDAFGAVPTFFLLWIGWVAGGITAFAIGRYLGKPVAEWFLEPRHLHVYEERAGQLTGFPQVLLFQLAIPSEIPGYVLGLVGCRFRTFVGAMALAELPFALGAVFLGESFLARRSFLVLAVGAAGVALSWFALRRLVRFWKTTLPDSHDLPRLSVLPGPDAGPGSR